MANIRQREFALMDMMANANHNMSSEDKLFMHSSNSCPVLNVVGGRLVSGGSYPINGQQLQMQMDQLASAMSDMGVEDGMMEDAQSPAFQSYMQHRSEMEADTAHFQEQFTDPHCQAEKRRDPVYLASMATHRAGVTPNNSPNNNTQQQQQLFQQQMILQQQQQMMMQQQHQPHINNRLTGCIQIAKDEQFGACGLPMEGEFSVGSSSRLMKRPDMIPMQKCIQWT
jgi:hypothetical protein